MYFAKLHSQLPTIIAIIHHDPHSPIGSQVDIHKQHRHPFLLMRVGLLITGGSAAQHAGLGLFLGFLMVVVSSLHIQLNLLSFLTSLPQSPHVLVHVLVP